MPAAEAARRVAGLALGLEGLGVTKGDRVALLTNNRPEWHLVDFALHHVGAVNVSIYATLLAPQVEYILRDSGARAIVVENAEQLDKVLQVRGELPDLQHVVLIDGEAQGGVISFADLVRPVELADLDAVLEARRNRVTPEDLATLIYTSGTTGQPKGAMLTHDNFVSNVTLSSKVMPWPSGGEQALAFLPLSHVLERLVDYIYFYKGVSVAYCMVVELAEALKEVRPHLFTAVPRVYEKIHDKIYAEVGHAPALKQALFRKAIAVAIASHRSGRHGLAYKLFDALVYKKLRAIFGGRLRFSISGGAPLPVGVGEFFHSLGIWVLEGYGLTETSPVVAVNPYGAARLGTVGRIIEQTEVKIAPDGEVLVRGRQVMRGYWRNPEATAAVIDVDGWFATGDVGELTDDNYLRITDRKKDLIITAGGKNVAPQPIENDIKMSTLVENIVLFGDRRPFIVALVVPAFEELVRWATARGVPTGDPAALVADPRVLALYQELIDAANAKLARYETIKRFRLVAEAFTMDGGELTPTLKVKRRVVAERYGHLIEEMYAESREA